MINATCVLDAKSLLGEGPLWDVGEQRLYWVDIKRRLIHRSDPATGEDRTWSTPEDIGSLAVREQGGLLVALKSGFHFYNLETGRIHNRRVFIEVSRSDGATVDSEGFVWLALWDGWRVVRYDPAGIVHQSVKLPIRRPTCPMFGGSSFEIIYVTSASFGLSDQELKEQPLAGGLFAFEPGVSGLPEMRFKG
ncbi:MAG: SMP-30/gluconolactonase/LRE family protein [Verrucomicrobia bacterium]|nr:SMP-30/gluconolactonase/LRE family protein [Verrucomicrobiota bacterium]